MADHEQEDDTLFSAPQAPEPPAPPAPPPASPQEQLPPEPAPPSPQPVAPEPSPPQAPNDEQRHVPLRTFLDARDEAKELKRQLEAYKAEQQRQQQQPAMPDPYDNPEGYAEYQSAQVDQRIAQVRFEMSQVFAEQVHGAGKVEQAVNWAVQRAQADPGFAHAYMTNPNPVDWIVRQHQQQELLGQIGTDPDAYVRRRAAELGLLAAPTPPAPPAAPPQAPVAPPASLVDTPGNGGVSHVPTGTNAGLDALFKG